MTTRRILLLSLAAMLTLAGCNEDDGSGGPVPGVPLDGQAADSGGAADAPELDPETGMPIHGDASTGEEPALEIILLHDTSFPVQIGIQSVLTIRAKVVDYASGGPARDMAVGYSIVANSGRNGGAGDATLSSEIAFTDASGLVQNQFRANNVGDVNYTVRLAVEGAEPVFLDIIVSDAPKGSLEVHLAYEGPIAINTITVRLMPKSFICGTFTPTTPLTGSLADKTVLKVEQTPTFDGIAGGTHFTVVATAKGPSGTLAAAGCQDGVFVVAGQKTPATVALYVLPLNPAGAYDVDNYFDFTGALPALGTAGEVIQGIVTLFNNPGKFLIDQIKTLVAAYLGQVITDLVFGPFESELAKIITDWVKEDSPGWLQDFFTIGDDLTQIVDHLHLKSVLKISKLNSNYYIQGLQYWNGIVLSWKFGCDKAAPDYETCGQYTFSMEDLANTEFPQEIIEGTFTGSVVNYDQIYIDNHVIKISYGKLILFVLNELLLKTITGFNNIQDAALDFVNCPSIAATFSNGALDFIGISEDDLAGICESVIVLLIAPLEAWIGNLALDSQLRLSGKCTMRDTDEDLYVDKLTDGTYLGTIEVNAGQGPTFTGGFSGTKQPYP